MATDSPPGSGRRARKSQQLSDRVAIVAFSLFEEHGYTAVSMERIAAATDLAKGTLYKYFPVKEALLVYKFQRDIALGMPTLWQILEQQRSFAEQLKSVLHASEKWNEARRGYIALYVDHQFSASDFNCTEARGPRRWSEERELFERLCVAGQQRGDVRGDLAAAQLAVMLECLYLGAIKMWLGTPGRSLKAEFDALRVIALNGVTP